MSENSDFNDQAKAKGKLSVAKKISSAIDATKGIKYGNFTINTSGVTITLFDKDGQPKDPIPFSSLIKPLAICRTNKGDGVAILFEMRDIDGKPQKLILKSEDLHTGGGEIHRIEFARRGGWTAPGIRIKALWPDFFNSILKQSKALPRLTLSTMNGWHLVGGKYIYILNAEVIGTTTGETVINPSMPNPADHQPAGTLATAQQELFRYAVANSRLMLALCTSFVGTILTILQEEPGVIHLFGASSISKTTALFMLLSVWGNPRELLKTWNGTGNALVALLAQRNDGILALDELGLCSAEQAGHTVYVLTAGREKERLKQNTELRDTQTFRTMGFSTGEQTLSDFMRQSRHNLRPAAGQEVRMLDVPADPGEDLGLFQDLCGFGSGATFSNHLKSGATQNYGVAIRVFLKRLVDDRNDRSDWLQETLTAHIKRFMASYLPTGADGQVNRACHRFGIIAAAGELAAAYGVLPFPEGDAIGGVGECFDAWLSRRGTSGQLEVSRLLDQVSAFFERNGENCFVAMDGDERHNNRPIVDRYGFRRAVVSVPSGETSTEYFVFSTRFKELVSGFDSTWAAKQLLLNGIIRGTDGRTSIVKNLPGEGKKRCYHFFSNVGGEDHLNDELPADIPF